MRSEMNQFNSPESARRSSHRRFAPAASDPAERDDASHRVSQNDMPPLAGLLLSAAVFTALSPNSLTAVSGPFSSWSGR
jgi:hypothetical protein